MTIMTWDHAEDLLMADDQAGPVMSAEQCSECQRFCAVAGSAGSRDGLAALARKDDGSALCDVCVGRHDLARLAAGQPIWAYLASDGLSVTTWGGTHIGYVETRHAMLNGFHGSQVMAWKGVTNDGVEVYGRGAGRGMATSVRPRLRGGAVLVREDD